MQQQMGSIGHKRNVFWLGFKHERKQGVFACIISYDQNFVVLGFCQESIFSKDAQFNLVECI